MVPSNDCKKWLIVYSQQQLLIFCFSQKKMHSGPPTSGGQFCCCSSSWRETKNNKLCVSLSPSWETVDTKCSPWQNAHAFTDVCWACYVQTAAVPNTVMSPIYWAIWKKIIMFHKSMLKRQTKHLNVDAKKEGAYKIASRFEAVHLISWFMALIDGTNILPPWHGYMNFESRKGWPSFVLQAVVNNELARHFITSWLSFFFIWISLNICSLKSTEGIGASH